MSLLFLVDRVKSISPAYTGEIMMLDFYISPDLLPSPHANPSTGRLDVTNPLRRKKSSALSPSAPLCRRA